MKSRLVKRSSIFGFCIFFVLTGCVSAVTYQFTPDELNAASISFQTGNPNLKFVSFEGKNLPAADKGTYWDPILFPALKPMLITVHAHYDHEQKVWASGGLLGLISDAVTIVATATRYVDTDVVLTCPSLMPGTKYQLFFKKEAGIPGKNILVLKDLSTKKVIYRQEFETKEKQ